MARILIVEDESSLTSILSMNLTMRGHEALSASSVETAEALVQMLPWSPDLVLLDINLPDHTGWDLLRFWRARSDEHPPAVIVMTAIPPTPERIKEFTPAGVLVKPFPIDALLRLIARILTGAPNTVDTTVWTEGRY
jgi:DNA-binding response OmpR family regulator